MTSTALLELLRWFEGAGIEVWLEGGWGVDALLETQTRAHKDLDILLRVSDVPALRELLWSKGFSEQPGGTPSNFVLAHPSGLEVDVHAVTFAPNGDGIYRTATGADWAFPAKGFSGRGAVNGQVVRCLSPEIQVLCHAHGYAPAENDFQDMARLQQRFGVELPSQLKPDQK